MYVTGWSEGSGTAWDMATVAYDPSGQLLWAARYNGPYHGDDKTYAIAVDEDSPLSASTSQSTATRHLFLCFRRCFGVN